MHARIQDGQVVEYPIINLYQRLPEVSLPFDLTDDDALPQGFVYVRSIPAPEFDPMTHRLQATAPVQVDGLWQAGYIAVPLNAQELEEAAAARVAELRVTRNQLLAESDWTQVLDAPVDRQAWAAYRQALRAISTQQGFPFNVEWPVAPVAKK